MASDDVFSRLRELSRGADLTAARAAALASSARFACGPEPAAPLIAVEADWLSLVGPGLERAPAGSSAGYDRAGRLTLLDHGTGRGWIRLGPGTAERTTYLLTGVRRSAPVVIGAAAVDWGPSGGLRCSRTWLDDADQGELATTRTYVLEGGRPTRCHQEERALDDDGPGDEVDCVFERTRDGALAAVLVRRKGQPKPWPAYRAPAPPASAPSAPPTVAQDERLAATLADELVRLCGRNHATDLAALALVRSTEGHDEPLVAVLPRAAHAARAAEDARDVWSLLNPAEWESLEARRWTLSAKVAGALRERSERGASGLASVLDRALELARPRLEALGSGRGLLLFSTEPSLGSLRASVERHNSKRALAAFAGRTARKASTRTSRAAASRVSKQAVPTPAQTTPGRASGRRGARGTSSSSSTKR